MLQRTYKKWRGISPPWWNPGLSTSSSEQQMFSPCVIIIIELVHKCQVENCELYIKSDILRKSNAHTTRYLERTGFVWQDADERYLCEYVEYFRGVGWFEGE